jgi:23S rRNA (adenine2503-C2)-methyltransferase
MEKLLGKSPDELKAIVKELGMPSFTAGQIADWLYKKDIRSVQEMTNLSAQNRNRLAENFWRWINGYLRTKSCWWP